MFAKTSSGQILPLHNYTIKDGLISDNIESICQDSLGFIWFGTGEGISIFDSREFRNLTTINGLSSNKISYVTADKKIPGDVWIGTVGAGVNRYHNGKFSVYGSSLPSRMTDINSIFQDDNNIIWCGTDSGFYFIQNDSIHLISSKLILKGVSSFAQRTPDEILAATEMGLFRYFIRQKKLEKINLPGWSGSALISMLHSKNGFVYAAAVDGHLYKINYSNIAVVKLIESPRTMAEDEDNNLWIGAVGGLIKISEDSFSADEIIKYNEDSGLLENNITSLLYDRENILWIGLNDNGLSKLTYQNLIRFRLPKKYIGINWASAISDNNNHFWLALKKYLLEIWKDKNNNWHQHFHAVENYNPNEFLPYLFAGKDNKLYVGKSSGEISIYEIKKENHSFNSPSDLRLIEKIIVPHKIKYTGLFKCIVDNNGYIWCSAIDAGVLVINNSKPRNILKIYTQSDGLPDNSVRDIFQDSKGNIWFGGYDGGLSVFSYGKILKDLTNKNGKEKIFSKLFTTADGLPDNGIRSIEENSEGEIIIGTRYGGLAIYNPEADSDKQSGKSIKSITREEGLFSNAIWSITKTPGGKIWLGTQSGVQELTREGIPSFKLYEELPKVPYYSICSAGNGDLCFANQSDVYIYEPAYEVEKNLPPPVYIDHLSVNGQEIKLENNLSLASYQNTITVEFVGIINREERNTIYQYRLLDNDKKWNTLKNRNSVTYASLRPGNYIFQVIAINGKNIKSKIPAEISFVIEAPFYMQWWFIVLVLLLIISSVVLYLRVRFKRLIEIEKIRTRIAADLHDEIGSGLTRIAILSENALREESSKKILEERNDINNSNEKYSRHGSIERVGKISRDLVDSMIDVIWSIDPKYDSLRDFIFNFKNFANEVCEAKNIRLVIETENIENVRVNSQIKRSLQLITKEALNNALKYSSCKIFKLTLSVKNKIIHLILEDDGTGFDLEKVQRGHGLFNITKHIDELNGTLKIDSVEGMGTKLLIGFPIQS